MKTTRHALPLSLLHDLRTPLNHILGYTQLLIDDSEQGGHAEFLPDLQKVHMAGEKLLALINDNFQSIAVPPEAPHVAEEGFAASSETLANPVHADTGTLLIVDDIEANREILTRRLDYEGYATATASNGRQALEMVQYRPFDLILLDIMMPEMDGFEVLQHLKADENSKHIPVIMISALDELDAVVRCIDLGAEDYLPKPFNPTLLKARIGASLDKKRAHDREMYLFQQLQQNYLRLQELEKQRDALANMIVHDLRTPLSSVMAGMQTLDMVGDLNPEQQEIMSLTLSSGQTLLSLINDLLDVEKMETGAMPLDMALLNVAELIESAIAQVLPLVQSKQLALVRQIAPDLPAVQGDENKLSRTLVNLLANAIKFTPPGGVVTIEVRLNQEPQELLFSISDTGEGIPVDAFERIFEKFGQVESRQSGRVMSTGLGLTFCKLAVEAHGGHIGVESRLGQGSTFYFTIPAPAPLAHLTPEE